MDTVTITLAQEDLNSLVSLLDVAVKATGLQGARAAVSLLEKFEAAVLAGKQSATEVKNA